MTPWRRFFSLKSEIKLVSSLLEFGELRWIAANTRVSVLVAAAGTVASWHRASLPPPLVALSFVCASTSQVDRPLIAVAANTGKEYLSRVQWWIYVTWSCGSVTLVEHRGAEVTSRTMSSLEPRPSSTTILEVRVRTPDTRMLYMRPCRLQPRQLLHSGHDIFINISNHIAELPSCRLLHLEFFTVR